MRFLISVILTLLLSITTLAQDGKMRKRIKSLKIAFITERLDLTETEAQRFWPIYNTFEENNHKLKQAAFGHHNPIDIDALSDSEAEELLKTSILNENKRHELRSQFIRDLSEILPAKKIILLNAAERKFNRRMLEEIRNRRKQFKDTK